MTENEKTILRTLIWFEIFDIAPTAMEIFHWQMKPYKIMTFQQIQFILNRLKERNQIKQYQHFFARVSANSGIFQNRINTYVHSHKKQKIALLYSQYLKLFTGIKSISLCNTRLPLHSSSPNSDIDFFITCKTKTLWLIRFLSIFPLKILRQRPGEKFRNALDLSFFLNHQQLNISHLAEKSPEYFAAWLLSLETISGELDFISHNKFAQKIFPNKRATIRVSHKRTKLINIFPTPAFLNSFAQKLQFKILPAKITQNQDGQSIIMNDQLIKLHTTDRAEIYTEKFYELCRKAEVVS